jgi:hypothetical protein
MTLYLPLTVMKHLRRATEDDEIGEVIDLSDITPGCIGVIQVFDNLNDAMTAYPNSKFNKIEGECKWD